MRPLLTVVLALSGLAASTPAATPVFAPRPADDPTLHDLLVERGDFTVLLGLFELAGLADELTGDAERTLFAPDDDAFGRASASDLEDIREPECRDDLRALLRHHLVDGRWTHQRFATRVRVASLHGQDLALRMTGDDAWTVDAGTLLERDVPASNGVLHVVDEVLPPAGLRVLDDAARFGGGRREYEVDTTHSAVLFRVMHMEVGAQWGLFRGFAGKLVVDADDPTACSIVFAVDVSSIDTGNRARDDYLQTADFFDADEHPGLTFRSTSVRPLAKEERAPGVERLEVTGELTLLGTTRPLTFIAEKTGEGRFGKGVYKVGYETTFTIRRSEFGMTYGIPGVAGDEVRVTVALEGNRPLGDDEG